MPFFASLYRDVCMLTYVEEDVQTGSIYINSELDENIF